MKAFALRLLIKYLVKYLDIPSMPKDQRVHDFLASAWQSPGFRSYIAYRQERIIYELAGGSGLTEKERSEYIRFMGQRLENMTLGLQAKKAFQIKEKQDKEKLIAQQHETKE
jgi:hypothetical protein